MNVDVNIKGVLIRLLARKSITKEHELILECLNKYDVYGVKELSKEQLIEFCKERDLL